MDISKKSLEVFCCYARKDQPLLLELKAHLTPLQREGLITLWADVDIDAGTEWEREIHLHLNAASLILLLVSSDFLASEYCYSVEMQLALERHEQGEARVISIILRPCDWKRTPLGKLQALPLDAKPITQWDDDDVAFEDTALGIRKVVEDLQVTLRDGAQKKEKIVTNLASQRVPQEPIAQSPTRKKRSFSWKATFGGIFLVGLLLVSSVFFIQVRPNQPPGQALNYGTIVAENGAQFGFNTQHTHFNPYELTLTFASMQNLKQNWKASTNGEIRSSPAIANGKLYIGSRDGYLYVFNANSCNQPCQPIWKAQTGYQIVSSPAIFHGTVYIGSDDKHLYAFDANGCGKPICQPLWKAITDGVVNTSPTVADGKVYVSAGGKLYAFNTDGTPLWKPFAPPSQTSVGFAFSPTIDHGIVYVGATDGKLYAFKEQDCAQGSCSPLWTAQTQGEIHTAPTVADGKVYISAGGKLYAFNINDCTQSCQLVWTAQIDSSSDSGGPFSSPAVANGKVYIGSRDGHLHMFNANGCGKPTCNPIWTALIGDPIQSSPMVAKDVVYVGSNGGFLYALNANGCGKPTCTPDPKRLYSVNDAARSSPAVADSGVYIGAGNTIYAFHLEKV